MYDFYDNFYIGTRTFSYNTVCSKWRRKTLQRQLAITEKRNN